VPVPASTIRWRLSVKAFSTARAMSYWPGRCSKARVERERIPPGEKKAWRVGISPVELGGTGAIWMGEDTTGESTIFVISSIGETRSIADVLEGFGA
jgi:hypothetical protein